MFPSLSYKTNIFTRISLIQEQKQVNTPHSWNTLTYPWGKLTKERANNQMSFSLNCILSWSGGLNLPKKGTRKTQYFQWNLPSEASEYTICYCKQRGFLYLGIQYVLYLCEDLFL